MLLSCRASPLWHALFLNRAALDESLAVWLFPFYLSVVVVVVVDDAFVGIT